MTNILPSPTLPVFDAPDDGLHHLIDQLVLHGHLDARLRHEIHDVFRAAIQLGVAALAAEPLTSVTVMPDTPISDSAARTSSSLKGLMMAVISFIQTLRAKTHLGRATILLRLRRNRHDYHAGSGGTGYSVADRLSRRVR